MGHRERATVSLTRPAQIRLIYLVRAERQRPAAKTRCRVPHSCSLIAWVGNSREARTPCLRARLQPCHKQAACSAIPLCPERSRRAGV